MGGVDVTSYEEFGNRYDVRLRYAETYRDEIGKFDLIQLRAADNSLIDFRNVAEVSVTSGPAQIDHYNRARKIGISANAPRWDRDRRADEKWMRLLVISIWLQGTRVHI